MRARAVVARRRPESHSGGALRPDGLSGDRQMRLWAGRILSAIPALMMTFSAVLKLSRNEEAVDAFAHRYLFAPGLLAPIGVLELFCVAVYLGPQTAVLGAILMTGYLGGAIATELRAGSPNWIGPLVFGIFAWLGLYLRDARLGEHLPFRRR